MSIPWQLVFDFLDIPTAARLNAASTSMVTLENWRSLDKHLWVAQGHVDSWDVTSMPRGHGLLALSFAQHAKDLWVVASRPLFALAGRELGCPGMLERAYVEVYVLGVNGCIELSDSSVRQNAGLDPDHLAAELGYLHQWLDERGIGENLQDAFLQLNEDNHHVDELVTLMHASDWSFQLFPAQLNENNEDAVAVLEFVTHGFTVVIVLSEIFVDPFGFVL